MVDFDLLNIVVVAVSLTFAISFEISDIAVVDFGVVVVSSGTFDVKLLIVELFCNDDFVTDKVDGFPCSGEPLTVVSSDETFVVIIVAFISDAELDVVVISDKLETCTDGSVTLKFILSLMLSLFAGNESEIELDNAIKTEATPKATRFIMI